MKIAIIGSSGFIGTELAAEALARGNEIVCIDMNPSRRGFATQLADVEKDDLSQLIQGCDAVVCLAAIRPLKEFYFKEYLTNIAIAANTIDACMKAGIKNGIFISSRSVYSDDNTPWREDQPNVALNLYGEAKAAVDNLVRYFNKKFDTRFKSLRLAQVMGAGEVKGYLLNTLLDNAANKKTSSIYGTGEGRRQFIYIKDVINAILHACAQAEVAGVFNIAMDGNVRIIDLADLIYKTFDDPGNYVVLPDKPEDLKSYEVSTQHTKEVLGFIPEYTLETAIEELAQQLKGVE